MREILDYLDKYQLVSLEEISQNEDELNKYVIQFSKDLGQLSDLLSRLINTNKHPNYYNLNEATIVGSITRIVKLYQESVFFYEQNKHEIFSQFFRPLFESFIIAKYLMRNGRRSQENFRLVSYRARYENFKKLSEIKDKSHPFMQRQLLKLEAKLRVDNFTIEDLEKESKKKGKAWKLDGKSFWKIHSEVDIEDAYSFIYGVGSDAVHGNWQEILDFHLTAKGTGYIGFLNYEKCDCRLMVPLNSIVIECLYEFVTWNEGVTDEIKTGLENLKLLNDSFYDVWERKFGEKL